MGSFGWKGQMIIMISEEEFRRKRKLFNIELPYKAEYMKIFPSARIHDSYQAEAYKWCRDNIGDNWIWSSPIQTDYTDVFF